MRVDWAEAAEADIDDIVGWIARDNLTAAFEMERRIRAAAASLETMPHRTRRGRMADTREMVVTGMPYLLVLKLEA